MRPFLFVEPHGPPPRPRGRRPAAGRRDRPQRQGHHGRRRRRGSPRRWRSGATGSRSWARTPRPTPWPGRRRRPSTRRAGRSCPACTTATSTRWARPAARRTTRSRRIGSLADVKAYIAERVEAQPPGTWIVVRYAFPTRLAEGRFPTRAELDAVAPDHPVLHQAGPAGVVNTKALAVSGITRETPDPPAGRIVKDPRHGRADRPAAQRLLRPEGAPRRRLLRHRARPTPIASASSSGSTTRAG